MRRMILLVVGLFTLVTMLMTTHCGSFMTDAATRIGYDVVKHAEQLRSGRETELTFVHHPMTSPEGCGGGYVLTFQESLHHPASGGGLLVACTGGVPYSTTYHLNAVRVPLELCVAKAAGADVTITLRKNGDAIEVVRLE